MDEDTRAFNRIMDAFNMPKENEAEKKVRTEAIQSATMNAIEVPMEVMKTALASMEVIKAMAEIGNPNSVSDAGVGALCARTSVYGAYLNVKINASGLKDKEFVVSVLDEAQSILQKAIRLEKEILKVVEDKIK